MDTFTIFGHVEETLEPEVEMWQLEQEQDESWLDLFRPDIPSLDAMKDLDMARQFGV